MGADEHRYTKSLHYLSITICKYTVKIKRLVNTPKICAWAIMTLNKIKVIIGKYDSLC